MGGVYRSSWKLVRNEETSNQIKSNFIYIALFLHKNAAQSALHTKKKGKKFEKKKIQPTEEMT